MSESAGQDLRIAGVGSAGGGTFRKVSISGAGKIDGDVECETFAASGAATMIGSVKAKRFVFSGAGSVTGHVTADEVEISGAAEVTCGIDAGVVRVSGASSIGSTVNAGTIEFTGGVKVKGDCVASEKFLGRGGFSVDGVVSAPDIDVRLYAQCSARELRGKLVRVEHGEPAGFQRFAQDLGLMREHLMKVDTIEAEQVYVEDTTARLIKAGGVRIGPRSSIEMVEHSGELVAEPGSYKAEKQV